MRIPHSYRILNGSPTPFLAYKMSPADHTRRSRPSEVGAMPPKKKQVRQHNHEISYWTGGKRGVGRFEALTNFGLKLLKRVVTPPELPNETCFVVQVTQKMGAGQSVERGWVV